MFTKAMRGDFLAGPLSAADFALYPLVAFLKRCEIKLPDLDADGMLTPEFRAWKARIEALPYFDKTDSAALEGKLRTAMELTTTAFADNGVDPGRIRVRRDRSRHARASFPATAIPISRGADCPPGTRSLALAVPRPGRAVARRRRQQGRPRWCRRRCRASTSSIGC